MSDAGTWPWMQVNVLSPFFSLGNNVHRLWLINALRYWAGLADTTAAQANLAVASK